MEVSNNVFFSYTNIAFPVISKIKKKIKKILKFARGERERELAGGAERGDRLEVAHKTVKQMRRMTIWLSKPQNED